MIPVAVREPLLFHSGKAGGHQGVNRTQNKKLCVVVEFGTKREDLRGGICEACSRNTPPNLLGAAVQRGKTVVPPTRGGEEEEQVHRRDEEGSGGGKRRRRDIRRKERLHCLHCFEGAFGLVLSLRKERLPSGKSKEDDNQEEISESNDIELYVQHHHSMLLR
eukprot:GHVS01035960.1.p1 GENE.GHVS01035960.1~~GHVS01035960.1.p1  ORF type:complete len:163 (+),score=34.93 GHVS01035960.1:895-1383(+)